MKVCPGENWPPCPCGLGDWARLPTPLWWESGPDPAIMELRKPEKNNASEMQREEEEVEGGRRDPEPGDLSVSVFKEANGPFPGKHLEHFKGNGNCLKRQSERRPRQPSAAGMDV